MFQYFSDFITYNIFHLVSGSKLASSVNFFFYDVSKIFALVLGVIFVISFVQTFIPLRLIKEILVKKSRFLGYPMAAMFGAISPFCSCSSIPLFIGFIKARLPLGIAFSFLVTSPLVNEVVVVLMGGMFGWKIAFLYAFSGIVLGVIAGIIIDSLKLEGEVIVSNVTSGRDIAEKDLPKTIREKLIYAKNDTLSTFKKLWWIIIIGVGIGAGLYGYVPNDFFFNFVGGYDFLAVPIAVLLGVPVYAGGSMVVPIIFSITQAGIPLGTSLAFMMSIAGLSLPEAIMLRRVISTKLLMIFFGLVSVGILCIGYLFNYIS